MGGACKDLKTVAEKCDAVVEWVLFFRSAGKVTAVDVQDLEEPGVLAAVASARSYQVTRRPALCLKPHVLRERRPRILSNALPTGSTVCNGRAARGERGSRVVNGARSLNKPAPLTRQAAV